VTRSFDAIALVGPPGSGKSFLGNHLAALGIASYVELEPILAAKFGRGDELAARIAEAGAFVWASYEEQLRTSALAVAIETTGVEDRALLDALARRYRVAFVHVETPRSVCVERVIARGDARNISRSGDPARIGRFYDLWCEGVAPRFSFALTVDGESVDAAAREIRGFLERESDPRRSET
jgi:shikimate kinase